MNALSTLDSKILTILENNARTPLTKIAHSLNTSQQNISYHIKQLEEEQIIGGYYPIYNVARIGHTIYRVLIRLGNVTQEKQKNLLTHLQKHGNVLWLVEVGGKWDILVNFSCKNVIHFNSLFREIQKEFPLLLQNYEILTIIGIEQLGKGTIKEKSKNHSLKVGMDEVNPITLDETDARILKSLATNARISSVNIATIAGVSPNTAITRIKELEKKGIIEGYKPLIHLEHTREHAFKILLKLHNLTEQREAKLLLWLTTEQCVVGIIKTVGAWNLEAEIKLPLDKSPLEFTRKLRNEFGDIIKETDELALYHEYKYNYFPADLLI